VHEVNEYEARVVLKALEEWHYSRAGETIDNDDRIAAELGAELEWKLGNIGQTVQWKPSRVEGRGIGMRDKLLIGMGAFFAGAAFAALVLFGVTCVRVMW